MPNNVPKAAADVKPGVAEKPGIAEKNDGSGPSSKMDTASRGTQKPSPKLSPSPGAEAVAQLMQSFSLPPFPAAANAPAGGANPAKTTNSVPAAAASRTIAAVSLSAAAPPASADAPVVQPEHLAFALAASAGQGTSSATAQTAPQASSLHVQAGQAQAGADADATKSGTRPAASAPAAAIPAAQQMLAVPAWQPGANGMGATPTSQGHSGSAPPAPAALPEAHEIEKPAAPDTLRTLRVQFVGDNNQRVDVRLGDASGQLRVSVRSTDAALTQTLQDRLPELTARLGDQHFHTEVWMPPVSASGQTGTANTAAGSGRSAGNFFAGGNPNGQGQPGGRQQGGQNQYRPAWIDDFGTNPRRAQTARRG